MCRRQIRVHMIRLVLDEGGPSKFDLMRNGISFYDLQEFHFMPDKFHFMTDKFHLMPDPTSDDLNRRTGHAFIQLLKLQNRKAAGN
jgi:hypothetical protein